MLSVIIATRDCERALVRTLAALVPGVTAGLVREVIVADGGSTDGTGEVADFAGCELVVSPASRSARLRQAAERARAPWLLFIEPGVAPDAAWVEQTARFIDQPVDAAADFVAIFREARPAHSGRELLWAALQEFAIGLRLRRRAAAGVVIARTFYDRLGGHHDDEADDVDLIARVPGRQIKVLTATTRTPD